MKISTLKYLWLTIKHKYFVYKAGRKLKVPIGRLLLHDISKFYPCELPSYGRQFFGKGDDPEGFIRTWIHHQNHNKHHWEYWIPRTGHNRCTPPYPDNQPVEMPEIFAREMVADWIGASRAYEGSWPTKREDWWWLQNNYPKIVVHEKTRELLEKILDEWFRKYV